MSGRNRIRNAINKIMSDISKYLKNDPKNVGADLNSFVIRNVTDKSFVHNEKLIKPGDEFNVSSKDALFFKGEGLLVLDEIDLENEKDIAFENEIKEEKSE